MLRDLIQLHDARPLSDEGRVFVQTMLRQTAHVPRPEWGHLPGVVFRYVDIEGAVAFNLRHDSPVSCEAETLSLQKLLEPQWPFEQPRLISAVWSCVSIDELVQLLQALQVVARFSADLDGTAHAHLVSAAFCVKLIREMEAGQVLAANGDALMDALTRSLGIRSQTMRLIQQQRREAAVNPARDMGQTIRWLRGR